MNRIVTTEPRRIVISMNRFTSSPEAFFQYGYHDMVCRVVDAGQILVVVFFVCFFFKTKLCNIYYKIDIECFCVCIKILYSLQN